MKSTKWKSLSLFAVGVLVGATALSMIGDAIADGAGLQGFSRLLFADDVVLKKSGETNLVIHADGDAATDDATLRFRMNNTGPAVKFTMGVDAGDSDKFKIEAGDGVGASPDFVMNSSGNVGLGTATVDQALHVYDGDVFIEGDARDVIFRSLTTNDTGRNKLQWQNNDAAIFAGDDAADQSFNFYAGFSATRANDAVIKVFGNEAAGWDDWLSLTHDGSDGVLSTGAGDLNLNPAGNVGIGEAAPAQKLHIGGSLRVEGGYYYSDGTNTTLFLNEYSSYNSGHSLKFKPGAELIVGSGESADQLIADLDAPGGTEDLFLASDSDIFFYTGAQGGAQVRAMTILAGGNIGVGDTAPSSTLEVKGTSQTAVAFDTTGSRAGMIQVDGGAVSAGSGGGILLGAYDDPFASIRSYITDASNNGTGHLIFSTRNATSDATLTERLRILQGGNVGIGSASPGYTLDVNGTIRLSGTGLYNSAGYQMMQGNATDWLRVGNGSWTTGMAVYLATAFNGGGVAVGEWTARPAGVLTTTDYAGFSGGVHVGGTTDPGTDNLVVDGTSTLTGNVGVGTGSPGSELHVLGGEIRIEEASPQLKFVDTDGDDYWIHVNAGRLYVLWDELDDGDWDTPYPLYLQGRDSFFGGEMDLGGNKIVDLATPTADTDAATKAYVDSAGGGSDDGSGWTYVAALNSTVSASGYSADTYTLAEGEEYLILVAYNTGDKTMSGSNLVTFVDFLGPAASSYNYSATLTADGLPQDAGHNFMFNINDGWTTLYFWADGAVSSRVSAPAAFRLQAGKFDHTGTSNMVDHLLYTSTGNTLMCDLEIEWNGKVELYDRSTSYDVGILIFKRS